jgi:hypothetical protein
LASPPSQPAKTINSPRARSKQLRSRRLCAHDRRRLLDDIVVLAGLAGQYPLPSVCTSSMAPWCCHTSGGQILRSSTKYIRWLARVPARKDLDLEVGFTITVTWCKHFSASVSALVIVRKPISVEPRCAKRLRSNFAAITSTKVLTHDRLGPRQNIAKTFDIVAATASDTTWSWFESPLPRHPGAFTLRGTSRPERLRLLWQNSLHR